MFVFILEELLIVLKRFLKLKVKIIFYKLEIWGLFSLKKVGVLGNEHSWPLTLEFKNNEHNMFA